MNDDYSRGIIGVALSSYDLRNILVPVWAQNRRRFGFRQSRVLESKRDLFYEKISQISNQNSEFSKNFAKIRAEIKGQNVVSLV